MKDEREGGRLRGETPPATHRYSVLTDHDIYLFREGTHGRLYRVLGCHLSDDGAHFAVWAPNAGRVSVISDWSGWDANAHPLQARADGSGIWQGFVPRVAKLESAYERDKWPAKTSGLCKAWCPVLSCEFNGRKNT